MHGWRHLLALAVTAEPTENSESWLLGPIQTVEPPTRRAQRSLNQLNVLFLTGSPPPQLRGGSVLMGLHRGEDSTLSRVEEVLVNDGEWHHLQLDISSLGGAASLHKAVLSLDQGLYLVSGGVHRGAL